MPPVSCKWDGAREMGCRGGDVLVPQPSRIPHPAADSHPCLSRGVGRGAGSWYWGSGGVSLLPPPLHSGLPGDALGGAFPAKRIGFLEVCEKAPAEAIPAAISDNKALY